MDCITIYKVLRSEGSRSQLSLSLSPESPEMFTKSELTGIVYNYEVQLTRTCQGKTEKEKPREGLIKSS